MSILKSFFKGHNMKMYRAIPKEGFIQDKKYERLNTKRIPSNITYLIDNIWESLRPENMPSRRFSAYASPTIELALINASANTSDGYIVTEVLFNNNNYKLAHLKVTDARYHSDIKNLTKIVLSHLGSDFSSMNIDDKIKHSPLFLPSVSRKELEDYFNSCSENKHLFSKLQEVSTFWKDASIQPENHNGELFFEILDDCSYKLQKV